MKYNKLFFLIWFITSYVIMKPISSDERQTILQTLSKERYFPYQDIVINNEVLAKGVGPDCSSRYDAIKGILDTYKKPIKVLDIGASNGYFSLKIVHDYDALCVMVDTSNRLLDICKFNDKINGIVYLKKELSLEDLQFLNKNEHFDVVLALNVVHHMQPYKEILDILFQLGDAIIIETPPANDDRVNDNPDIPNIEKYLINKKNGICIAQTARAASNNFEEITSLETTEMFLAQKEYTPNAYAKMFYFENPIKKSEDIPFFKLSTFQKLNGLYSLTKYLDIAQ